MKWRPAGWTNPNRLQIIGTSQGGDPTPFSAFEEGADAMLEALKKHGSRVDVIAEGRVTTTKFHPFSYTPPGTLVFIPDNTGVKV